MLPATAPTNLDLAADQTLLLAVIAKNAFIINATCGSGNVITCAIGVTYSVFTFFFAAWKWQDRADTLEGENPFFAIGPTPTQTLRQRLATELDAGQWHYVGHVHHQGVNHTVHYFNHGDGVHQLRAHTVPFANGTDAHGRRFDEDDDGGFVGDYYWNSDNKGPYDSFHSTDDGTHFFAANAAGYMVNSQQAIAACAGFTDAQGPLDNGILAYGWNDKGFVWFDGQMQSVFGTCQSELGDGPL